MVLKNVLAKIKASLEENDYFDSIKITNAYVAEKKPTRLNCRVIALGIEKIDFNSSSVGQNYRTGDIRLFADVFLPACDDTSFYGEIICEICKSLYDYNVLSISADRIKYDTSVQAYIMKCTICLGDVIQLGGTENE